MAARPWPWGNSSSSSSYVNTPEVKITRAPATELEQETIDQVYKIIVGAVTGLAGFVSVGIFTVLLVYLFVLTQG